MSEVIVLVTGGFDPIHSGHIAYLKDAKKLGDKLIVGVNSDQWLVQKKGSPFLPIEERIEIVSNLSVVDKAIEFTDDELNSASGANHKFNIYTVLGSFKNNKNVEFEFGVGGDFKKNSSSWILKNWQGPLEYRPWGWFRVIDDSDDHKIKEIQVNPNSRLSYQSHAKRSEVWTVIKGDATVLIDDSEHHLKVNNSVFIPVGSKHRLENNTDTPLNIIEVQTGTYFGEDDIVRYEDDYDRKLDK